MSESPLILIIDDNRSNIGVVADYLEKAGYRVTIATDSQMGIFRAGRVHPDLILLDVRMPGKGGFEVCCELNEGAATEDIPVIFLTAYNDVQSMASAFQSGGVDYLSKPVRREELLARVATHLEIVSHRKGLEAAVAEKTALLQEANSKLMAENDERQQRLVRSRCQQEALAELISHPGLTGGDMEVAADFVTRRIAEVVDVGRVGVWQLRDTNKILRCIRQFNLEDHEYTSGEVLQVSDYPSYFDAQKAQWVIAADDVLTDPRTQEMVDGYLTPCGITSMLDVAIRAGDELVGVICLEHIGPKRNWQADEISFVRAISDRLAQVHLTHCRQKAEEQLHHNQKMDAIGRLAGGVAHDFNNMLGGIIGAAELLEHRLPKNEDFSKYLGMIMKSAERAAKLAEQLLVFGRKQPIRSSAVDIHGVIHDTVDILRNTVDKRVTINLELDAELSTVFGDLTLLQNVFLNLGINSAQAMPEGGTLSFHTVTNTLDDTYCTDSPFELTPGRYIDIAVRDTGCGMDPEIQGRIFEPFFTTKAQLQGTGLGLAAAYGTVQQHKGEIYAYSESGTGTSFRILLPLTEQDEEREKAPEVCQPGAGVILVVDDEPVLRATAENCLTHCGYEVLLAADGEEAVACYREHSDRIDLVVCDMIMPRMNGRDCFAALKKLNPDVRVLLASGFTQPEDTREMREQGLAGFIMKPFRGVELSRAVADAMKG